MENLLILKGNIIFTQTPEEFKVYKDSYIVSNKGKIEGIYNILPEKYQNCLIKDYRNRLIIPTFVDLHLHASQFIQCGMGMNKKLLDWLNDYTFKLEKDFSKAQFAQEAYNSFADELIKRGTLRACIFATSSTIGTEILFEILKKRGIGAYIGKVDMDRNAPESIIESKDQLIKGTKYLIEKYKNEKLVKPIITPRFAPTCSDELLKELGSLANKYDLPVQSHLDENLDEIKWVQSLFPKTKNYSQAYYLNDLFGQTKTVMAHCIYLNEDEINLVRENNVMLVHCPDSNINLRSGIMPVRKYLDLGVPIGLGSDIAGGHRIALNESMVRAVQLSKILNINSPGIKPLSIQEVFYLGTKSGGKFFGNTGSFEKGYSMDALIIEDDKLISGRYSIEDRLEKFIYTGDDRNICARYVEGKYIEI